MERTPVGFHSYPNLPGLLSDFTLNSFYSLTSVLSKTDCHKVITSGSNLLLNGFCWRGEFQVGKDTSCTLCSGGQNASVSRCTQIAHRLPHKEGFHLATALPTMFTIPTAHRTKSKLLGKTDLPSLPINPCLHCSVRLSLSLHFKEDSRQAKRNNFFKMRGSSADVLREMGEIIRVAMTSFLLYFFLSFQGMGNVICRVSNFIKWAITQNPSKLSSSCCQIIWFNMAHYHGQINA